MIKKKLDLLSMGTQKMIIIKVRNWSGWKSRLTKPALLSCWRHQNFSLYWEAKIWRNYTWKNLICPESLNSFSKVIKQKLHCCWFRKSFCQISLCIKYRKSQPVYRSSRLFPFRQFRWNLAFNISLREGTQTDLPLNVIIKTM